MKHEMQPGSSYESGRDHEVQHNPYETVRDGTEQSQPKVETSVEHDHSIDKLQESIHKEALSSEEITVGEEFTDSDRHIMGVHRELKDDAYRRTIQKVRGHLNPVDRAFSKVVHNRIMNPISEASGKTVGRPSGLLGGGIAALAGSCVVLYMAKYYGFRYNFTIFLLLLAGGFATGLLIELLFRFLRRKRA